MIYDDKEFIGKVIRNARKKARLSQAQLSEKINMCDKNLGNIENGKQFPQVNNFLRILEVLDLSLEDFGVENKQKNLDNTKEELLKIVNSSTPEQAQIYLKTLKFVDAVMIQKS